MASSLVASFDELVAATDILNVGSETVFSEFITSQIGFYKETDDLKLSNKKQNERIEAKDIELKLSRNSLQKQMDKCSAQEEKLKEYEKQYMILKMLISSDDKLINLNEAERRSLAILTQRQSISSPGLSCTDDWGTPETSVNVTDATDLDDEEGGVSYQAHWKRRRTASSEWTLDSSITKRKRSVDSSLLLTDNRKRSIENIDIDIPELNLTPTLEKKFKRPPPGKNRRKPSKGHLIKRSVQIESPRPYDGTPPTRPSDVPLLDLPRQEEDSPVPSAPPEVEVAYVNSGMLSPLSNEGTPPHTPNPDFYAAFPHSPLSPLSMQPLPLTPSMGGSPRLYPTLEEELGEYTDDVEYDTPTQMQPLLTRTNSDINMTRKHIFQSKTALKLENCEVCKKKVTGFGKNFYKCKDCRAVCCGDCQNKVPLPCIPTVRTPKKKQKDSELSAYCPTTIPRVPSIVIHCVKELENRGLTQVGLYRVPGSERNIRELKDRLLKSKGTTNLNTVDDVNVLCGCIKQFLISLKEPLVTHKLNPLFLLTIDEDTEEKVLAGLLEVIAQLPPCNKDTLAFTILHLQKVIERADKNKMPLASIASVFGPTIIGSTSNDPAVAVKELKKQRAVMERLLSLSSAYWRQYLSSDDSSSDYAFPRTSDRTPIAISGHVFNSPSTPELMPIPQSPFLGPCQSPRSHRPYGGFAHTPVVTRSNSASASITASSVSRSAKKNGFFAAIN